MPKFAENAQNCQNSPKCSKNAQKFQKMPKLWFFHKKCRKIIMQRHAIKKSILKQLFYYFFAQHGLFFAYFASFKIYHLLIGAAVEKGRQPSTKEPPPRGAKPDFLGRRMRAKRTPKKARGTRARTNLAKPPSKKLKSQARRSGRAPITAVGTNVQINFRSSVEIGVTSRAIIRGYRHFF